MKLPVVVTPLSIYHITSTRQILSPTDNKMSAQAIYIPLTSVVLHDTTNLIDQISSRLWMDTQTEEGVFVGPDLGGAVGVNGSLWLRRSETVDKGLGFVGACVGSIPGAMKLCTVSSLHVTPPLCAFPVHPSHRLGNPSTAEIDLSLLPDWPHFQGQEVCRR